MNKAAFRYSCKFSSSRSLTTAGLLYPSAHIPRRMRESKAVISGAAKTESDTLAGIFTSFRLLQTTSSSLLSTMRVTTYRRAFSRFRMMAVSCSGVSSAMDKSSLSPRTQKPLQPLRTVISIGLSVLRGSIRGRTESCCSIDSPPGFADTTIYKGAR